MVKKGFQKWRR